MRQFTHFTAALFLTATLSACQDEEVHSVAYFTENREARAQQLAACELQDNVHDDANCRNASTAERDAMQQRERDAIGNLYGEPSFD